MSEKKHILVVEDEHHLAVGIKFNLQADNYDVTVADDGRLALKIISESGHNKCSIRGCMRTLQKNSDLWSAKVWEPFLL